LIILKSKKLRAAGTKANTLGKARFESIVLNLNHPMSMQKSGRQKSATFL